MEESANRKLRLKAMRMEAAEAEASSNIDNSTVSSHLCNPLAEPSVQESLPTAGRFDYYTDPMAAYSGNKRKTQKTVQDSSDHFSPPASSAPPGPGNFNMMPSPRQQYDQTQIHPPGNFNMPPSPRQQYDQTQIHPPGNFNMPPSPCQQYNQNQIHPPGQGTYRSPSPYQNSAPWRSPTGMAPQFAPQQHGSSPVFNRPGGPPNSPIVGPNLPMIGGHPSPGFEQGGSPNPNGYQFNNFPNPGYGQRGPSPRARGNNPYQNGGRGGRGYYNNNPNFGYGRGGNPSPRPGTSFNGGRNGPPLYNQGRGRGRGFHGSASAQERPDLFYNRSMLEDPWKNLKPIVRKVESWLPKSIREEKTPKGVVSSGSTKSGLSFAEELAASYEEAAALAAAYENTSEVKDDMNNV